ncbi:cyclic nucleotide-binding domain-containing protein [Limibacillus sp. MBR-115]|jgi:CRP/FNR family transcriptional regulator|uniref:Crp/Fnr family transcriptional regulator n=1 Tax=Limibacillus sp. MBR-115 TaxID=3156465 RepID=UPI0033935474
MPPFDVRFVRNLEQARPRPDRSSAPCVACAVRHLTVCAPLNPAELAEFSTIMKRRHFEPANAVFDEGDLAKHVFNVTSGVVKIYKLLPDGRRQVTGFLIAGDFLGLANEERYAYSAEAVTDARLCCFPRQKFEAMLDNFPAVERQMLMVASHELAAAQEQMLLLGRKTAKEKIASFLLRLSSRYRKRGLQDNPIHLPMSRNDIGDFLGLTTETVSRTFTQLKSSQMIRLLPGGLVELCDIDQLEDIAEGM